MCTKDTIDGEGGIAEFCNGMIIGQYYFHQGDGIGEIVSE